MSVKYKDSGSTALLAMTCRQSLHYIDEESLNKGAPYIKCEPVRMV
jgi:hypothetical protein